MKICGCECNSSNSFHLFHRFDRCTNSTTIVSHNLLAASSYRFLLSPQSIIIIVFYTCSAFRLTKSTFQLVELFYAKCEKYKNRNEHNSPVQHSTLSFGQLDGRLSIFVFIAHSIEQHQQLHIPTQDTNILKRKEKLFSIYVFISSVSIPRNTVNGAKQSDCLEKMSLQNAYEKNFYVGCFGCLNRF